MAVSSIGRPVVYKGFVINVERKEIDKYIFTINQVVEMKLSGIARDLPEAFDKARAMIDKITEEQSHE
jgi:hypothetical protein